MVTKGPSRQGARPGEVNAEEKIHHLIDPAEVGAAEQSLDALLPVLYLRGVSTSDFQEALAALLGKDAPNLSPAVISRLTAEWPADYDVWVEARSLGTAIRVRVGRMGLPAGRMEDNAECMLVLIGARGQESTRRLPVWGAREREGGREPVIDIKQRGLSRSRRTSRSATARSAACGWQPPGSPPGRQRASLHPYAGASASRRSGRTPADAGRTPRRRRIGNTGSRSNVRIAPRRRGRACT